MSEGLYTELTWEGSLYNTFNIQHNFLRVLNINWQRARLEKRVKSFVKNLQKSWKLFLDK